MAIPTYSGDDNPYNNEQFDVLELSQFGTPRKSGSGGSGGSGGKRPLSSGRVSSREASLYQNEEQELGPLDTSIGALIDAANAFNAEQGNNIQAYEIQPGSGGFGDTVPYASSSSPIWSPTSPAMQQIDASVSTLVRVANSFQWNPANDDEGRRSSSPFIDMDEIMQQYGYYGSQSSNVVSSLRDSIGNFMPQDREAVFGASTSPDGEDFDSGVAAYEVLAVIRSPESRSRDISQVMATLKKDNVLANVVSGVLNEENWLKEASMVQPYKDGKKIPNFGKAIALSSPPLNLKFLSYQDALDGLALFSHIYELPSTFISHRSEAFQASFAASSSSWHRLNIQVRDWAQLLQDTHRIGYLDYEYGTIPLPLTNPNAYCYRALAVNTLAVASTGSVNLVMAGGKLVGLGALPSWAKKVASSRKRRGLSTELPKTPPAALICVDLSLQAVDITTDIVALLIAVACKLKNDTRIYFIADCRKNGIQIQFTKANKPDNEEDLVVEAALHLTRMGLNEAEIEVLLRQMFGRLDFSSSGKVRTPKFTRAEAGRLVPEFGALRLEHELYAFIPK